MRIPSQQTRRRVLFFPLSRVAVVCLAGTLFFPGCATNQTGVGPKEGDVIFQAGAVATTPAAVEIVPGPLLERPGILVPAFDPAWQAAWLEGTPKKPATGGGAAAGFAAGIAILQVTPVAMLFWPAAVGVVAGTTAMGAMGGSFEETPLARVAPRDRAALLEAAAQIKPDSLLREAGLEALAGRLGRPPTLIPWQPPSGPETPAADPLAAARGQGLDGVLSVSLEAFGLAAGEDPETYGVFLRVRARIVDAAAGRLRYERVLDYGPIRRPAELPRPAAYTIEFLSMDRARVFRQEVREAILRVARLLAEDPALPLPSR